jgi:protein-S-isoprenylcysteine O-methyltransferase Ste14
VHEENTMTLPARPLRQRLAALAAALVACVACLGAVATLFHDASTLPWLAPGPGAAALLASCDGARSTAARHACVSDVVARVRADAHAERVAELEGVLAQRVFAPR